MVMMISLLLVGLMFGAPPVQFPDGARVPDHFYRRIIAVDQLPPTYGTTKWGEGRFGSWLEASSVRDPQVVATLEAHLGSPLLLPPWGSRPARAAYVWALRESAEAGLLILIDHAQNTATLKIYLTGKLPSEIAHRPESYAWEYRLMQWFRAVTTAPAPAVTAPRDAIPETEGAIVPR